jgi:hypothetical protein
MATTPPKDIKLYLGVDRRVRVDELAQDENRSVSDAVSQLLDAFLDNYASIKKEAHFNHRTPIMQVRMWVQEGAKAQLALGFIATLARGDRPSDATCIELAAGIGCNSEVLLRLRDCAFSSMQT